MLCFQLAVKCPSRGSEFSWTCLAKSPFRASGAKCGGGIDSHQKLMFAGKRWLTSLTLLNRTLTVSNFVG